MARQGASRRLGLAVEEGGRICAIPLEHVRETFRPLPTAPVGGAPDFVLGVSVIRGEPVPVVGLGRLLGDGPIVAPGRFVTLRVDASRTVALAVERVLGVFALPDAPALANAPPLVAEAVQDRVSAVGVHDGKLLLVLAAARIVPAEVWREIERAREHSGSAPR